MPDEAKPTLGERAIDSLKECLAHARGEIPLRVTIRLPDSRSFPIDTQRDMEVGAGVWIATSPEIPGLVIQGATWPEMMTKLTLVIPSLIDGCADANR